MKRALRSPTGWDYQFGQDQGVIHQIQERGLCVNVVKRVGGLQAPVERVVHHSRWQSVETSEVRQRAPSTLRREQHNTLNESLNLRLLRLSVIKVDPGYLHYKCVDYIVLWQEPVRHLLFRHRGCELEAFQELL